MHIKFLNNITGTMHRFDIRILLLGILCVSGSFFIGVDTAGEGQPANLVEAGSSEELGDIDGSGVLDIRDAIIILEVVQGYREATPAELRSDPDGDGSLTVDDALDILSRLALR